MGVYFSLCRIKKDNSYIKKANSDFITVDFDLKESFFVEFIDTLLPTSTGIHKLLENDRVLSSLNLNADDFLFFTKAGDLMEGHNVEIFFDPNIIMKTIKTLHSNNDILLVEKIFDESELMNLNICKDFLDKAISDNNYVQFYWQ